MRSSCSGCSRHRWDVALTRNQLLYVTFDETAAAVAGLPVAWYNRIMVMLTALVVVGAMQIMGVILVAAMLVVPVAGATQVSRSFSESLLVSIVLAELAVLLGIGISYYAGATSGGVTFSSSGNLVVSVFAGKVRQTGGPDETREHDTIAGLSRFGSARMRGRNGCDETLADERVTGMRHVAAPALPVDDVVSGVLDKTS